MQQLFLLTAGSWDENHPIGIFSSIEHAKNFIKKFNITDNVKIQSYEINPLSKYVYSDVILYRGSCKKKGKIQLVSEEIYEYFTDESVHFNYNVMYYSFK